jgi:hypothetical protein
MFKKLFYRRSLATVLKNLSQGNTVHFDRVVETINHLNDLYLVCAYGDHFKQKIEAEQAMLSALNSVKELKQKEIFEIEMRIDKMLYESQNIEQ